MRVLLDRGQRLDPVMGEHKRHHPVADLPAEFLQYQSLEIGLIVDDQDRCSHAACPSRVSISWRSSAKSIGLVKSPTAPRSIAFRRVSASPYAVIMITGTSGRSARTFGSISRPLMPGMLMSDKIRISEGSRTSAARTSAAGADGANSIVKRPDLRSRRNC